MNVFLQVVDVMSINLPPEKFIPALVSFKTQKLDVDGYYYDDCLQ